MLYRPPVMGSGTLRYLSVVGLLATLGCARAPETGEPSEGVTHHKPRAPVTLALSAEHAGGSNYWVTATATPTEDTAALEIVIHGPAAIFSERFESVSAGQTRSFRVPIRSSGARIRASARTDLGGDIRPNLVGEINVGTPAPQRSVPTRAIALPSGERIEEVRR